MLLIKNVYGFLLIGGGGHLGRSGDTFVVAGDRKI